MNKEMLDKDTILNEDEIPECEREVLEFFYTLLYEKLEYIGDIEIDEYDTTFTWYFNGGNIEIEEFMLPEKKYLKKIRKDKILQLNEI